MSFALLPPRCAPAITSHSNRNLYHKPSMLRATRLRPACRSGVRAAEPRNPNTRGFSTLSVDEARKHCAAELKKSDYQAHLLRNFIPRSRRDAYDAIRAFNVELARMPELVTNPAIGQLRMQTRRDAINKTFAGSPPNEPIMILLHDVLSRLQEEHRVQNANSIKFWLLRIVNTREKYMDNRPFPSLAALEEYAENTYSTLMYSILGTLSVQSMHIDHLVSHIGKACGIAAILRSVPILAVPPPPVKSPGGYTVSAPRNPALLLPLDVMADVGCKEEDVYRQGPNANGLRDAMFTVATRANDHLITAREMLKNLRNGRPAGHDYEHMDEAEHMHHKSHDVDVSFVNGLERGFGVLLEAVLADEYLARLQRANFDPFDQLRSRAKFDWRLPYKLYKAHKNKQI